MSKSHDQHRSDKKKAKYTLKEKRKMKREKREKANVSPIEIVGEHTEQL